MHQISPTTERSGIGGKLLRLAFVMLLILGSGAATADDKFDCWGSYSNIEIGKFDASGLELIILSPKIVYAVVAEGDLVGTQATNIEIIGNRIYFDYFENKFSGVCEKKGISFLGFDDKTGKRNQKITLRSSSFIASRRVLVKWID